MAELIHKELSYEIVGILYTVYKGLGGGYQEKYYQRAIALELEKRGLKFKREVLVPLEFGGKSIGRYFVDFVIEDKIVLEIKVQSRFYPRDVKQILSYLKITGVPLGILANFARNGLLFKRVLRGKAVSDN